MMIYAQMKPKIYNVAKISTLELSGRAIVALVDGQREILGIYTTTKRAQFAFDELAIWLNTGADGRVYRLVSDTEAMRGSGDNRIPSISKLLREQGIFGDAAE